MPGLEEEAFFRGVLLLALNEAFLGRRNVLAADLGWGALLSSVLFGSAHGIAFDHGVPTFTAMAFLTTFLSALILAWLRERTGSLVAPVIGHNVGNGAFTLF
jgi:membrane protease YdiL (CAAX protease family)